MRSSASSRSTDPEKPPPAASASSARVTTGVTRKPPSTSIRPDDVGLGRYFEGLFGAELLCHFDERACGRRAVTVAMPCDPDQSRRQQVFHVDRLDAAVRRLQREPRDERHADARAHEALHRSVVVRAKDDAWLGAGTADRELDSLVAPALPVADQRLLCDLAQRRR